MAATRLVSSLLILWSVVWLIHCVLGGKPTIDADELKDKVDEFVAALLSCRYLTASNVAVVQNGETLFTEGYGVIDLDSQNPVTNETLFGVASLTKAFAQALLGIVLEESTNGYTWDTPVRDVLGEDFYLYDALRTTNATIRDLLSHRVGLPDYNDMRHQSGLDRETLAQKIRFLVPYMPFRANYKYHNLLYGLLAHVTETIGGDTWENLIRQRLYEPLGMTSSELLHQMDTYQPDLVKSYELDNGEFRMNSPEYHFYWRKLGAAGSVVSNAVDMTKWLKMQLADGRNETGFQVVPEDVLEEARTRVISIDTSNSDEDFLQPNVPVSYSNNEYGLGWRAGFYRGWRTYLHTGSSFGYLAQLTIVPDLGIGIYNSFSGEDGGYTCRRMLHIYIMDLLMGETPWLNSTSACTFLPDNYDTLTTRQSKQRVSKLHDDNYVIMNNNDTFELYVGTFGNFAFGNISFYVNASTGGLMMAYGDLGRWELHAEAEEHSFDTEGIDHVWNTNFGTLTFSYSQEGATGPLDVVTIPDMGPDLSPQFVRDLTMDDAPPPPTLTCPKPVEVP